MTPENEDSSSEDEFCRDALQEAIDHEFVKDEYFSEKTSNVCENSAKNNENHIKKKDVVKTEAKSLRRKHEEEKFDNFGVSATFQQFVAKKLDELLEKSIELEDEQNDSNSQKSKTPFENNSVRLLNSCRDVLTTAEDLPIVIKRKRSKKEEKTDEKNNLMKCKEAAVNPDWILSKMETKAWSNRQKGHEFKYKRLKNGTLVELETNKLY